MYTKSFILDQLHLTDFFFFGACIKNNKRPWRKLEAFTLFLVVQTTMKKRNKTEFLYDAAILCFFIYTPDKWNQGDNLLLYTYVHDSIIITTAAG